MILKHSLNKLASSWTAYDAWIRRLSVKQRVLFVLLGSLSFGGFIFWANIMYDTAVLRMEKSKLEEVDEVEKPTFAVKIKVEERRAESHQRSIVMYGSTQPSRDVSLNAQTQGEVIAIPANEGELLQKGDVILEIDARERPARVAEAKALLRQREIEYEAARKLTKRAFQTEIRLAESKAQLEQARAELKRVQQDLDFTKLTAPFDGRLERVNVEIGDFVGIGTFGVEGAAARIVDNDPLLVIAQVAEKDRAYVRMGLEAYAELADGRKIEGLVSYVGNVADQNSRTFRIEVEVPNAGYDIPAGVTAELTVPGEPVDAYNISPSMLALDDAGRVGVKYLDSENKVHFASVEIIEEGPDGMWVFAEPASMRLIVVGQAYVSAGQTLPAEAVLTENEQ